MAFPFEDSSKCSEIAKLGDWLLDALPQVNKTPEHFWDAKNLWRSCIVADGRSTIARYRAMQLLNEQGLVGPAGDLSRPIAETAFRLDYLSGDDNRLIDYARWQLLDCYHRVLKSMRQNEAIPADIDKKCADEMAEIKTILGDRYDDKPPRATWKPFNQLISFKSDVQNQDRKRQQLYTATGVTLSRGLHNAWLSPVPARYGFDAGRIAFLMAMHCVGRACIDKDLVSAKGSNYAKKIVDLCNVDGWSV